MHTIAGGVIIEPNAVKAKRFNEKYISELKVKESGEVGDILENTIKKLSNSFPDVQAIIKAMGKNEGKIEQRLEELVQENKIIKLISSEKPLYVHQAFIDDRVTAAQKTRSTHCPRTLNRFRVTA